MDIVQHCLSLTPVPGLGPAFGVLRFIWLSVEQAQSCQEQLVALTQSTAQLLETLDVQYRGGRLSEANTSVPLRRLVKWGILRISDLLAQSHSHHRLLQDVSQFAQARAAQGFLKSLFAKDQIVARIEVYHRRIVDSVSSFQVHLLVSNSACRLTPLFAME